ncbi:MAG: hypothetical protein QM752_03270 [Gammaproteobacteria bacterium]
MSSESKKPAPKPEEPKSTATEAPKPPRQEPSADIRPAPAQQAASTPAPTPNPPDANKAQREAEAKEANRQATQPEPKKEDKKTPLNKKDMIMFMALPLMMGGGVVAALGMGVAFYLLNKAGHTAKNAMAKDNKSPQDKPQPDSPAPKPKTPAPEANQPKPQANPTRQPATTGQSTTPPRWQRTSVAHQQKTIKEENRQQLG